MRSQELERRDKRRLIKTKASNAVVMMAIVENSFSPKRQHDD